MIYITGDKHGLFYDVLDFCLKNNTTTDDILIVLGDAGINYYADNRDLILKNKLKQYPITFFCIHGNHEERPEELSYYKSKIFKEGIVYYEDYYPNILFAKDAEIYNFNDKKALVIGGAYSVDKAYRLMYKEAWYPSEQPSLETKEKVLNVISKTNRDLDYIFTHTCPYKYIPKEMFISGLDQSLVDNTTEYFLDDVEETFNYKKWYCGHFHTDKEIDNIRFMYHDIKPLTLKKTKK